MARKQLRTPATPILPIIRDIEDEKAKEVFEEYNQMLRNFFTLLNSDLNWLEERISDLE